MPVSQISICNSALVKIGADVISSITQETKSARLLHAIYDQIRDEVMRAHPWNSCVNRAVLAPTANTPAFGYDYEYDWPNDCLRPLEVNDDETDWVSENRKILCNEPTSIEVRYIFRNEDESSWDAMFAEAFAWRLARELAYAINQSMPLVTSCDQQYRATLAEARSIDGAEGILKGFTVDDWTGARK